MNVGVPENAGWWIVRGAAWTAALLAAVESEYNIVDGFIPAAPGDPPPAGYVEDVPAGALESFQVQTEIDGVSHTVTFSLAADQSLIPIAPVALTGSASSASGASGTLTVAGAEISPDPQTEWVTATGPDPLPEVAHTIVAETNERLPVAASALTGSASSVSGASGTLAASSADILADPQTEWLVIQGVEPLPEVAHSVTTEGNERLPVSALPIGGTASSLSGASGTTSVAGTDISPDPQVEWLAVGCPPEDAYTAAIVADGEVIPVDGTVIVTGDTPPGDDNVALSDPDPVQPISSDPDLPVAPVGLSGTAASVSTASGILSVAGVNLDVSAETLGLVTVGPDPLPEVTASIQVAELNGAVPTGTVALSGSAASVSGASGTLTVAGTEVDPAKDTAWLVEIGPDPLPEIFALANVAEILPVNAVALTGTATSVSTASGSASVAGVDLSPDKDSDWLAFIEPDRDHLAALLAAADAEVIPVSGATPQAGDLPPGEDPPFFPDLDYHAPYAVGVELDLPAAPLALSGTAVSTSAASGTLGVGRLDPTDAPTLVDPEPSQPILINEDPVIGPVSLSGSAASTSGAAGTLGTGSLDPTDTVALIELIPPLITVEYPEEILVTPVGLTGSAASTSGASGTIRVAVLPAKDTPLTWISTDDDPTYLFVAVETLTVPETAAAVPGDQPPGEDEVYWTALDYPEADYYVALIGTANHAQTDAPPIGTLLARGGSYVASLNRDGSVVVTLEEDGSVVVTIARVGNVVVAYLNRDGSSIITLQRTGSDG